MADESIQPCINKDYLLTYLLTNNLYLTYHPLEYSTNWKSGEGCLGKCSVDKRNINTVCAVSLGLYSETCIKRTPLGNAVVSA